MQFPQASHGKDLDGDSDDGEGDDDDDDWSDQDRDSSSSSSSSSSSYSGSESGEEVTPAGQGGKKRRRQQRRRRQREEVAGINIDTGSSAVLPNGRGRGGLSMGGIGGVGKAKGGAKAGLGSTWVHRPRLALHGPPG